MDYRQAVLDDYRMESLADAAKPFAGAGVSEFAKPQATPVLIGGGNGLPHGNLVQIAEACIFHKAVMQGEAGIIRRPKTHDDRPFSIDDGFQIAACQRVGIVSRDGVSIGG